MRSMRHVLKAVLSLTAIQFGYYVSPAWAQTTLARAGVTSASSGWAAPGQGVNFSTSLTPLLDINNVNLGYALINTVTGARIAFQASNFNLARGQPVSVSQTFVIPAGAPAGKYRAELTMLNGSPLAAAAPLLWSAPRAACFTVTAAATATYGVPLRGCSELPSGYLYAVGSQIVDASGNPVRISSIGWTGTDGIAGAASDGLWSVSYKTVLNAIRGAGFNAVRMPWTDAILYSRPDRSVTSLGAIDNANTGNNADLRDPAFPQPNAQGRYTYKRTIDIFQAYVDYAGSIGLKIFFDHHSNEGERGQQANGIWFDLDPAYNFSTDGYVLGNGRTTYATFKSNTLALAQKFANNPTVIGFELHNEPISTQKCDANNLLYCSPVVLNWGVTNNSYDIKFMAQDVGNAIQAVNPGALVIVEAPFESVYGFRHGAGMDPTIEASHGDLTAVLGFGTTPPNPVVLGTPHKTVYSVHGYPFEITEFTPAGASYTASYNNAEWGNVVSRNIAPVMITETGVCIAGANTSADARLFVDSLVAYTNGKKAASAGPVLSGNRQGIGVTWWLMGNTPNEGTDNCDNAANRRPNGIQTQWGLGNFRPDALAATDQFLFNGIGDVTPHNSVVGVGASLIDANHNSWAIRDGQVTVNGIVDQATANVVELAYVGGKVWCKITANLWYSKTLPTDAWSAPATVAPLTPSPSSSVIVSGSGELIDLNGNAWSIGGGKVLLNGVMDASTADVVQMVYYGRGQIVYKTAANAWFWKRSASQPNWSALAAPFIGRSPNNAVVTEGGGAIVDGNQNAWTIVAGQVVVNGVVDAATSNVIELAYVNGAIWQKNINFLWWSKTLPATSWAPTAGTSLKPPIAASRDKSVAFPGRGSLVDANGADWTISNGKVAINGILDTTTADVVQLAYVGGKVWRKTAANLWWSKTSLLDMWAPVGGTSVAPL